MKPHPVRGAALARSSSSLLVGPLLGAVLLAAVLLGAAGCAGPIEEVSAEAVTRGAPGEEQDPLAFYLSRDALDLGAQADLLERLSRAVEGGTVGGAPADPASADRILSDLAALGDWSPLLRAEVWSRSADPVRTRAALDEIDPSLDFRSRWGERILVDAYERAEDLEGAREAAREAAEEEEGVAARAGHWLRAGQLSLAIGDTAQAVDELREALDAGERFAAARSAAVLVHRLVREMDEEEEIELGRVLLAGIVWEPAVRRLEPHLGSDAFDRPEGDELRVALGRAYVELRRWGPAVQVLAPVAQASPAADQTAAALYWTGRAALGRGATDEAAAAFRRIRTADPGSSLAADGLVLVLERERETGFGPRARALLDEVLEAGVSGVVAESLVTQLGSQEYLAGAHTSAASVFDRYRDRGGRGAGRQQAAYWAAMVRERTGDRGAAESLWAEAHAVDPYSYYGLIAGERLGRPVIPAGIAPGPGPVPGLEAEIRNALLRLHVVRIVGAPGTVAFEVERLSAHFHARGDGAYDFAEALVYGGFPLEGVALGREIVRRAGEWNLRSLRIVHPFPYRETVVREATARDLDPFLVAGVIRQESLFHAPIRSSAGAVGLMQLMPPTAREVAGTLGVAYSPEVLSDPETNIRLGTTYLANMTRRFGDRTEDVLSAYNAGPTRARQWQQIPAWGDRDVFLEHIPFTETRNYVRLVQQYARVYAALYGCGAFEPCQ